MGTSELALFLGCTLWIFGLHVGRSRRLVNPIKRLEFLWPFGAFLVGGIGTLASFNFLSVSAEQVTYLRMLPMALIGVLMLADSLGHGVRIAPAGAMLSLLFGILIVQGAGGEQIVMSLMSLAIFLPAIVVPIRGYDFDSLLAGVRVSMGAFLLILMALTLGLPNALIGTCRSDKCSLWGESLGEVGTGNALGMFFAATAGITLLTSRRWPSFVLILAGSFLMADLTSSRSALYSWTISVLVALAYKVSRRYGNRLAVGAATIVVAGLVSVFPFLPWQASEFTGRGVLWQYAVQLLQERPLFGYGSSFWVGNGGTHDIVRNYSTHSIAPELLVSAGLIGTIAFGLALLFAATARRMNFETATYTMALIAITLGLSLTEVVSVPGRTYLVPGVCVFIFLCSQSASRLGTTSANLDPAPHKSRLPTLSKVR